MSYYDDFEPVNLMNRFIELCEYGRQFNEVYNGKRDNLSSEQMIMIISADAGYDLNEQAHDFNSEFGGVLMTMDKI